MRTELDRVQCLKFLDKIKPSQHGQHGIVPSLQRLIDLSFSMKRAQFCFASKSTPDADLSSIDILRAAWDRLQNTLTEYSHGSPDVTEDAWDFFLAYAHRDRDIAERLFTILSTLGRAFIDSRCLTPGEQWTKRLREAQDRSALTVVLITTNTPGAWYAESEYVHAIELMRAGGHRVVPVLVGKNAQLPYGLEQIHAITAYDDSLISMHTYVRDALAKCIRASA